MPQDQTSGTNLGGELWQSVASEKFDINPPSSGSVARRAAV